MSIDAIIMMVIGCGLLWGGFFVSSFYAIHCEKKNKNNKEQ